MFQNRPVLIIEVLSPSTRRYDLDEKMTGCLTIPALECYLVLEQHQPQAIVMRRTNGRFLREDIEGLQAQIDLTFLTGKHRLSFEIVGTNPCAVKAFLVGLDYFHLHPISPSH